MDNFTPVATAADVDEMMGWYDEMRALARRLALALAAEVEFAGPEAAEASLVVLAEARTALDLGAEFDEIDTLGGF